MMKPLWENSLAFIQWRLTVPPSSSNLSKANENMSTAKLAHECLQKSQTQQLQSKLSVFEVIDK